MIAKYSGKCCYCGKPITPGVDTYDVQEKKSFHETCKEEQEAFTTIGQFELADRLSFIEYWIGMDLDGFLRRVSETSGGFAAWGLETEAHRRQKFAVSESDTVINISDNRGLQKF